MQIDTAFLHQQLAKHVSQLPFSVSEQQREKLVHYVALMHKWNKAYNLTSVRDPNQMLVKHIIDSIAILPFMRGSRFIDVGTGPGLPGIPLAIMLEQAHFSLLDSLGKRVRFMKQCAYELSLPNIDPIQSRVEDYTNALPYDGVLSRAFASLKDMLHWCEHLVDSEGRFFALKGQYPHEELDQLGNSFYVEAVHSVVVPSLEGERHIVMIKKA